MAQAAMRYSSIDLTMNVYTDPRVLDVAGALDSLPTLPLDGNPQERQQNLATGTDDQRANHGIGLHHCLHHCLHQILTNRAYRWQLVTIGLLVMISQKHKKTLRNNVFPRVLVRGAGRIRTADVGFAIRCLSHLATAPLCICIGRAVFAWP